MDNVERLHRKLDVIVGEKFGGLSYDDLPDLVLLKNYTWDGMGVVDISKSAIKVLKVLAANGHFPKF